MDPDPGSAVSYFAATVAFGVVCAIGYHDRNVLLIIAAGLGEAAIIYLMHAER